MARLVKVGVIQAASVAFNLDASIKRTADLMAQNAVKGLDLVVFPEAFISGFPSGTDWGGPATGVRLNQGSVDYQKYFESAITIPSRECDALGELAKLHNVNLVIGVIERIESTLGCSVLHIDRSGALLHVRRKIMPTMAERTIWGQSDGASLSAVDFDFARVGTAICWENYMPLLRQTIYAQNIDVYCAPTADDCTGWVRSMQHIAAEGRCFVISACQFSRRKDFPIDYGLFPSDDPDFIVSRGGSCIVDPLGELIAAPLYDQEGIVTAEIDLGDVVRGRHSFDVSGHYARPDIFHLHVDRRRRRIVTFEDI